LFWKSFVAKITDVDALLAFYKAMSPAETAA
jgi:hypothetical protein